MITHQIVQLVTVGQLAMDLWRAQEGVANAEGAYHAAIDQYEAQHGRLDRLIRKDDPAHAAVREFTAPKYKALQQAKRRVYALKVRMRSACAKMARMTAEGGTAPARTGVQ
jgi:hypothetical protein